MKGKEKLPAPRRDYREGFRITRDRRGIRIEAIDYHCSPLFLDEEDLNELGLALAATESRPEPLPTGQLRFWWGRRRRPTS